MAPIRIPEGFVLVKPRSVETATALLKAAEDIGADRIASVRTVTGGYHVTEEVAEQYQKSFPEAQLEDEAIEVDAATAEAEAVAAAGSTPETGGGDDGDGTNPDGTEVVEPEPLPVDADSSHAEIDEYAASLDPKVEFPAGVNRAEKIQLLEEARQPKTDAE